MIVSAYVDITCPVCGKRFEGTYVRRSSRRSGGAYGIARSIIQVHMYRHGYMSLRDRAEYVTSALRQATVRELMRRSYS